MKLEAKEAAVFRRKLQKPPLFLGIRSLHRRLKFFWSRASKQQDQFRQI